MRKNTFIMIVFIMGFFSLNAQTDSMFEHIKKVKQYQVKLIISTGEVKTGWLYHISNDQ